MKISGSELNESCSPFLAVAMEVNHQTVLWTSSSDPLIILVTLRPGLPWEIRFLCPNRSLVSYFTASLVRWSDTYLPIRLSKLPFLGPSLLHWWSFLPLDIEESFECYQPTWLFPRKILSWFIYSYFLSTWSPERSLPLRCWSAPLPLLFLLLFLSIQPEELS